MTPLGMASSTVTWTTADQERTAQAYDRSGEPLDFLNHVAKASGGFYLSIEDLAAFVAAHLTSPQAEAGRGLLTSDDLTLLLSPTEATEGQYGLGYFLQALPEGGHVAWHDGIQPGWRTMFALDAARQDGLVVLTNSDAGYRLMIQVACLWAGAERATFCEQIKRFEG
jgi:CubicO group peptidase (beta-lactamase class C family)